jgi:hypothetical protein
MDDLIFSPEDIADYYGLCGLRLTASEQEQLYACSEGWISALYLIMLDYLKNGVFTPSGDISSLVRHVVYMPLNDELKSLLNHLCVFDAFTADQARYIWQKDNAVFCWMNWSVKTRSSGSTPSQANTICTTSSPHASATNSPCSPKRRGRNSGIERVNGRCRKMNMSRLWTAFTKREILNVCCRP